MDAQGGLVPGKLVVATRPIPLPEPLLEVFPGTRGLVLTATERGYSVRFQDGRTVHGLCALDVVEVSERLRC